MKRKFRLHCIYKLSGKIAFICALSTAAFCGYGQTNSISTSGNVGIGTTSPTAILHVNPALDAASAIKIGTPYTSGNVNVPIKGSPGGYNIDFYTWRDVQADQIGARIRAERINDYAPNSALVQAMDLTFSTSIGYVGSLSEKMRINSTGNVGIGTINPLQKFVVSDDGLDGLEVYFDRPLGLVGLQAFNRTTVGYSKMRLEASNFSFMRGNVGIGTDNAQGYKLAVAGSMIAESVKVKLQGVWPDFVFEKDYILPTLLETEKHIKEKGHLQGIPSAAEVEKSGIELGDMNKKLLQKIEELTLYLIEMKKENESQQHEIDLLKSKKN